jgi:hypothetical protein
MAVMDACYFTHFSAFVHWKSTRNKNNNAFRLLEMDPW